MTLLMSLADVPSIVFGVFGLGFFVYSLRVSGKKNKVFLDEVVERSLRGAALWEEAEDRLHQSALGLSGGQMQRLCIACAIANKPEIILMDEPLPGAGPDRNLQDRAVDHGAQIAVHGRDRDAQHAAGDPRVRSDRVLLPWRFDRNGGTSEPFTSPKEQRTESYISGRFG